ncbi:hypothetical protein G3435_25415, partial [Pseudomonas sp. MAFF212428]|nr:hypothetical protein [Pseudomonas brassicae]
MKSTENPGAPASTATRLALFVFGALLGLSGLALALGGLRLATLGGSWYYLLAGASLLAAGCCMPGANP